MFPQRDGLGALSAGLGGGGWGLLELAAGRFEVELPRGFFLNSFKSPSSLPKVFVPQT